MTEPKAKPDQIYDLMSKVMADIGAVKKTQRNQAQNYQFRGIDDALAAAQPVLIKHGVFCCPEVIDKDVRDTLIGHKATPGVRVVLTVKHTFYAPDGSSVVATTVGEGLDTSDKACNKAMSGAFKYALFETFAIPTEDQAKNDADHDSPQAGDVFQSDQYKTLKSSFKKAQPTATAKDFQQWASEQLDRDMSKKANWDMTAISTCIDLLNEAA